MENELAEFDQTTNNLKIDEMLTGGKHQYPAEPYKHISPMNSAIFALVQSSINLQNCYKVMSARYIAKYAAGFETRAKANFSSSNESNSFEVHVSEVDNSKIAGVRGSKKIIPYHFPCTFHYRNTLVDIKTAVCVKQYGLCPYSNINQRIPARVSKGAEDDEE